MRDLRVEPRPYLAMGKGPHHKNNRVATGHQLSHITDDRDRKRSANFHTANWEMIRDWVLNYLKKERKISPKEFLNPTHVVGFNASPSKASGGHQLLER